MNCLILNRRKKKLKCRTWIFPKMLRMKPKKTGRKTFPKNTANLPTKRLTSKKPLKKRPKKNRRNCKKNLTLLSQNKKKLKKSLGKNDKRKKNQRKKLTKPKKRWTREQTPC